MKDGYKSNDLFTFSHLSLPAGDEIHPELRERLCRAAAPNSADAQTSSERDEKQTDDETISPERHQPALPLVRAQQEALGETWTAIRSTPRATRSEFRGNFGRPDVTARAKSRSQRRE